MFENVNGDQDLFKTVNNRMIAAKGRNNDTALDIQISFSEKDGKSSTTFEGTPVVLAEYEPDKQIQQKIAILLFTSEDLKENARAERLSQEIKNSHIFSHNILSFHLAPLTVCYE